MTKPQKIEGGKKECSPCCNSEWITASCDWMPNFGVTMCGKCHTVRDYATKKRSCDGSYDRLNHRWASLIDTDKMIPIGDVFCLDCPAIFPTPFEEKKTWKMIRTCGFCDLPLKDNEIFCSRCNTNSKTELKQIKTVAGMSDESRYIIKEINDRLNIIKNL